MKKRIGLALAILAMGVFFVGSPSLSKRANAMPLSNSLCNVSLGGCQAIASWSPFPSQHGMATTVEVDNPGQSGFQSYIKFIRLWTSSNNTEAYVGVIKGNLNCNNGNLTYFWEIDRNGAPYNSSCFKTVPAGDINQFATFKISYYVSHGGGFFFWVFGHGGNWCNPCGAADSDATASVTSTDMDFWINYSSFSGHQVWGSEWDDNQYFNGTSWLYDNATSSIEKDNNNGGNHGPPPQMYWSSVPDGSTNNGGSLYSCLYDSNANFCSIGS